MGYSALQRAAKLNIERKRRLRRHRVVSMLAAIVVFCTAYALILPAITMEPTYFCGKEEHTHTDDCYGYITCETLICDAGLHSHDGECLDENGYVACGKADYFIHSHNSYCYNNDGKLICALKEVTEHVHTDSCYEAPSVPVTEAVILEETVTEIQDEASEVGGTTVTVTDEETGQSIVHLGFSAGTTGTFYYKISEIKGEESFIYDENFYIVEVSAYDSYALITGVYKNGTEELTANDISFINTRKTSLYVSKLVDSVDREGEFSFSALITLNGEPFALPPASEDANYIRSKAM